MATIDPPDWFRLAECSLTLQKNTLLWRSQFDGTPQTVQQPGERWVLNATLPRVRLKTSLAAERRAFFNRLAGGRDRLRCWNFAQPSPLGTLRGPTTLGASAARGDSTLTIAGALSGKNLLYGGGMGADFNADNLSDQLSLVSAGSFGTISYSRFVAGDGGIAQSIQASALGTSDSDYVGFRMVDVDVSSLVGQSMTLAADVRRSGGAANLYMTINWLNSSNALVSQSINSGTPLATFLERKWVTGVVPVGAVTAQCIVLVNHATAVGTTALVADSVQFEIGATPTPFAGAPTLLAGDMLGCNGQLFEVRDTVELSDNGTGVVTLNNRVRAPIASGASVTWYRPTALFITAISGASVSYTPGWQEPIACDLEEVWDA